MGNLGPAQATGGENICLIRGPPALFPTKCSILRGPLNPFTSSAEMNSACGKVLPPSGGKTLGRRICGGTKSSVLRGPRSGDWRGKHLPYSRPSSSSIHRLFTASLGIRLVGVSSVSLPPAFWPEVARSAAPPLPTKFIILRGPHLGDWRGNAFLTRGLPAPPSRGCSRHQTASASRRGGSGPRSPPWGRRPGRSA